MAGRGACAGEMVFKNVELRLDVLQEELGLPLVFTRGFIQVLAAGDARPLRRPARRERRRIASGIARPTRKARGPR